MDKKKRFDVYAHKKIWHKNNLNNTYKNLNNDNKF